MTTGLELAAVKLGAILVKVAARAWLGDTAPDVLSSELTDMLENHISGLLNRRRAVAAFTKIGDRVAQRIVYSYGTEFRNLKANERAATITAVGTTFLKVPLTNSFIVSKNVDAAAIEAYLRSRDPGRAMREGLDPDGRGLYDILLHECTQDLVGMIRMLPPFSPAALTEVLRRLTELAEQARITSEKLLARVAPFDYDEFEELYRRHASEEMRSFDLEAPDLSAHTRTYDLNRAYIDMTVSALDSPNDRRDLSELAAQTRRLAIVGEGRSGTTGALRRLFLQGISRSFTGPLAAWNDDIPIFLQLRSFESKPLPPDRFLARVSGDIVTEMPQGWVQHNLRRGKVLLLINGLAEVSPERREAIIGWLRRLVVGFPEIRYVVESSIIVPELSELQQLGFNVAKLNNIRTTEIAKFIDYWHDAVASGIADSEAKARVYECSRQLDDALKACPQLSELACNPTLCALICAFHLDYNIDIPNNWMEILPLILTVILDYRDRRRDVDKIELPYLKYIYLASDLAYWLVRNKWSQVDPIRLRVWLNQKLPLIPSTQPLDAEAVKYDLLRRGILRSGPSNKFEFTTSTMRNYLAAIGIIAADDIGYIIAEAHKADMRDIIILVALNATPEQLRELLDGIRKRRQSERGNSFKFRQLQAACRQARDAALPVLRPGLSTIAPMVEGMP